jgi:hypothetical protein
VRVLLRLGEPVVADADRREDFREDVRGLRGREGDGQREGLVVDGEADEVRVRAVGGGEVVEAGDGERVRDPRGS